MHSGLMSEQRELVEKFLGWPRYSHKMWNLFFQHSPAFVHHTSSIGVSVIGSYWLKSNQYENFRPPPCIKAVNQVLRNSLIRNNESQRAWNSYNIVRSNSERWNFIFRQCIFWTKSMIYLFEIFPLPWLQKNAE